MTDERIKLDVSVPPSRTELLMVPFTCPTCGKDKCHLVFSHPFDPDALGAILGFMHPGDDGKNDPTKFAECGLTADIEKVKQIDQRLRGGLQVFDLEGVVRGKPKRKCALHEDENMCAAFGYMCRNRPGR